MQIFILGTKNNYDEFINKVADKDNLSEVHRYLLEKRNNNESVTYVRVKELQNVFYTTIGSVKSQIKKKDTKKEGGRIYTTKSIWAKQFEEHEHINDFKTII